MKELHTVTFMVLLKAMLRSYSLIAVFVTSIDPPIVWSESNFYCKNFIRKTILCFIISPSKDVSWSRLLSEYSIFTWIYYNSRGSNYKQIYVRMDSWILVEIPTLLIDIVTLFLWQKTNYLYKNYNWKW